GKKDRRLAPVATHLANVLGIVAADAVDTMYGKTLAAARDFSAGWNGRGKREIGHTSAPCVGACLADDRLLRPPASAIFRRSLARQAPIIRRLPLKARC